MDNVGIVVEDIGPIIEFLRELGHELEGRATIEGEWAGRVTGLGDQRVEIAMSRTADGYGRLELSRFITPPVVADHRNARSTPSATCGLCSLCMTSMTRLPGSASSARRLSASELVRYEDAYRLCYIHGPEGLLVGLAEELGSMGG